MTDSEFLTQAMAAARFFATASAQQMIAIKACDSTHLYCSPYLLELMGVSEMDILGKTIWPPLYDYDPDFEQIIIAEDQAIIQSQKPKMLLKINRFTTGLTPYVCSKTPLVNPDTQNTVSILFQGFEMSLLALNQQLVKASAKLNQPQIKSAEHPNLSRRERQVIFFFMTHLGSQEISDILHQMECKPIAKSTIDSLFKDQLYPKFQVYSRSALYQKLEAMGYQTLIPTELLKHASFFLSTMSAY